MPSGSGKLVAEKRAKLVGPIRAMESELKLEATKILSGNQIARSAVPPENTPPTARACRRCGGS